MQAYAPLLLYLLLGVAVAIGAMLVGSLLGIRSPFSNRKLSPYECGMEPFGNARIQFKAGYYLFALLFLVFDIETVFLFPCVTLFRDAVAGQLAQVSGRTMIVELGIFIAILLMGLVYAWRKGALKWE